MNEWIAFLPLAVSVAFGLLTMYVAAQGRDTRGERFGWFLLGFFLPIVGLVIAFVVSRKANRPAPLPPV